MTLPTTKDAAIDTAEAIVDSASTIATGVLKGVLDSELVKGLPIVKYILSALEVAKNVQNCILLKKIQPFLDEIASVTIEKRQEMIRCLEKSKYSENVGLTILDCLDRVQLDRKPKMIGMVFNALAEEKCTLKEFWRLLNAVEKLTLPEIQSLRTFHSSDSVGRRKMPQHTQQAYLTSGLASTSAVHGTIMSFQPNSLCNLFVELNLDVELLNTP